MSTTDPIRVLQFEKKGPNGALHCEMQVFEDGSAYIRGDECEMIFEESPDAWQEALRYLESRGYDKGIPGIPGGFRGDITNYGNRENRGKLGE